MRPKNEQKKILLGFLLVVFLIPHAIAQKTENIWSIKDVNDIKEETVDFYKSKPKNATLIDININELTQNLVNAPKRLLSNKRQGVVMRFPNQEGELTSYLVQETSVMDEKLQSQFPEIRSYTGKGIDDTSAVLKFSVSPQKGFSGMVLSEGKTVFIEPYTKDLKTYIAFVNSDEDGPRQTFICETEYSPSDFKVTNEDLKTLQKNATDGVLRTYRLALACTGEYAQFHGGTVAGALAAMNITMNRVNGIFERDLALTMVLIPNNQNIIFLDASTDPYTNDDVGIMLGQNQTTLDNAGAPIFIGNENYDIGHVLGTEGGGVAVLRSPCASGSKARGVTGISSPVGDTFDVDYVAHEMGHQFGGNHTQNNNCQRSSVSVEPGSASTIMGYAGICDPNVQNNSDDYFHGENIKEMWANISVGNSSACFSGSPTNNMAPIVDAGLDFNIPVSTAFVLRGAATDADTASGLTYCWEQTDTTPATMPPQPTNNSGPLFRSLDPSFSTDRYMPPLSTVMSGVLSTQWQVVPSVGRTMSFSLTVRDNEANGGATGSDNMIVNVEPFSTPFTVDTPLTWESNSTQQVTWVVGETNGSSINCQIVNILFTTDDGGAFTTLASDVPNTGTATITVPNVGSNTNAKILVEAADNIFYAVSSAFSTTPSLSVEENDIENLHIYPNPNQGSFNIEFNTSSGESINIRVYDIRGRVIYIKGFNAISRFEETIKLNQPQTGIYVLNISDGLHQVTKKIVID